MRVTFKEQIEIKCKKEELEDATAFCDDGGYKVQSIVYNVMVNGSGRGYGMMIIAARVAVGRQVLVLKKEEGEG